MLIDPEPVNQVEDLVRSLVATRLKISPESVPIDVPIIAELGLDSIEVIQFLIDIEERFPEFNFADLPTSDLQTLRQLVAEIKSVSRNK
jgi:acyl carrier protein